MAAGDNKEKPAVENGNFSESRHSVGEERRWSFLGVLSSGGLGFGSELLHWRGTAPSRRSGALSSNPHALRAPQKLPLEFSLLKPAAISFSGPDASKNAHFWAHFDVILAALFRSENIGNPSILLHF